MQYILFIHGNTTAPTTDAQWEAFFLKARESGLFQGGSEIGARRLLGAAPAPGSSAHIEGYMLFEAEDSGALLELLAQHPVVMNGGSVELCELPRS